MHYNDFLITAMDRFVWFILLVVTTHLVTEFTKINAYTRGDRRSIMPMNESVFLNAIEVPYWMQTPNHNLDLMQPTNEANNEDKSFSLRPLIDSIFEIPLSALSAVNRFVQRLTSGYSASPTTTGYPEKSEMRQKSS
ncbi:uncharacterized protein LOC129952682 isoform X2 [Eupeodes corollae]|uniref:uncharacterized protein LOC129952682 isoform X2 n=1 Tax=Eupeodes corollae TaxID=290404 RepID=UPI00248F482F|nr:uncharacterized protein LOC129952682 isoform X2 [Eupeodes corollae]